MNDDAHDTFDVDAAIAALRAQLAPRIATTPDAVLVGIETGGAWIASRLHAELGLAAPLCTLNISFYRDDFSTIGLHPSVGPSHIPAEIDGKTVILVDDGIATGATMRAAIRAVRRLGAEYCILAVPVAAPESLASLRPEVDRVECLATPAHFGSVGQWYRHFDQTSDAEVRACLRPARDA